MLDKPIVGSIPRKLFEDEQRLNDVPFDREKGAYVEQKANGVVEEIEAKCQDPQTCFDVVGGVNFFCNRILRLCL